MSDTKQRATQIQVLAWQILYFALGLASAVSLLLDVPARALAYA